MILIASGTRVEMYRCPELRCAHTLSVTEPYSTDGVAFAGFACVPSPHQGTTVLWMERSSLQDPVSVAAKSSSDLGCQVLKTYYFCPTGCPAL